ncbi:MAG TPA: phage tail tape measure protein [Methylomirabilota bacterium]|nr:phage tail tape measure protein [Methylomirabilota bacterium]
MADLKASIILELVDRITGPARRIKGAFADIRRSAGFAQLSSQLQVVGIRFAAVRREASALIRPLARLFALAGVSGVGALGLAVNASARFGDEALKTARKLGVAVEEFVAWREAADESGVEQEAFELGLRKFVRNTAEAVSGNKQMRATFRALKIELRDSSGRARSTTDTLLDVADALAKIEDQNKRVQVASRLFGERSGADFLNLLQGGSDVIRKQVEFFRSLDLIDEKGAMKSEEYNDALSRLRVTIVAIRNAVAIKLLPALTEWIQRTTKLIVENKEVITERILGGLRDFWSGITIVAGAISKVVDFMGGWKVAILVVAGLISAKLIVSVVMLGLAIVKAIFWLKAITPLVWAFNAALLANPITWVVVGIAALVAAVILLRKHWTEISDVIGGTIESWIIWIETAAQRIREVWGAAIEFIKEKFRSITETVPSFLRGIAGRVTGSGAQASTNGHVPLRSLAGGQGRTEVGGVLRIQIDSEGRPRVRELRREGALDFDVDAGVMSVGY